RATKTQDLENVLQQEDPTITNGKTEDSKRAYAAAKEKANQAVTKAKEVQRDGSASESDVSEAEKALTKAKTDLEAAKNGLRNVNKS
ncbi:hypothetical protein C5O69_00790, partial [Streptococcus pseudopneumoniae]